MLPDLQLRKYPNDDSHAKPALTGQGNVSAAV